MKYKFLVFLSCSLFLLSCKDNVSYDLPKYELNLNVLKSNQNIVMVYLSGAGNVNLLDVNVQHNDSLLPHRQSFLDEVISERFFFSDSSHHNTNKIKVTYAGEVDTFEYSYSDIAWTSINISAQDTIVDGHRYYYADEPYTLNFVNEGSPDFYRISFWYEVIKNKMPTLIRDEMITTSPSVEVPSHLAPLHKQVHIQVNSHWGPLPEESNYEAVLPINYRLTSTASTSLFFINSDI